MSTSLTVSKLLTWISASTGTSVVIAATPDTVTTSLLQECIDAADASISSYCTLPVSYPAAVELAITMQAARFWDRRKTSNGIAMGDFGAVRVGTFDADISALLAPYMDWKFG